MKLFKKLKQLSVFAIYFFIGCYHPPLEVEDIKDIEVYYIPLEILAESTDRRKNMLQKGPNHILSKKEDIEKVVFEISHLESKDDLFLLPNNIYVIVIFNLKNGGKRELLYDNYNFKMGSKVFKDSDDLLKYLKIKPRMKSHEVESIYNK